MKLDSSSATECEYELSVSVKINFIEPPVSKEEKREQEQMQYFIDAKCSEFLRNVKNQENLMRAILSNEGIPIISVA